MPVSDADWHYFYADIYRGAVIGCDTINSAVGWGVELEIGKA